MSDKQFHLSVVATTRNDNHGGDLTYRMQHFITGFVAQCKKHNLQAELILVEWNPPDHTRPLSEELHFPTDKGPCAIRIIRVPKEVHATLDHADKIPLYQMIGKNVGIRRARGTFVLATNIDILFSDEIVKYLRDHLRPGVVYRVDRLDVPSRLPETESFDDVLRFCHHRFFRINTKYGTLIREVKNRSVYLGYIKLIYRALLKRIRKAPRFRIAGLAHWVRSCFSYVNRLSQSRLHTNACGDFTLLSKRDWEDLRGYAEWNIFSWHVDSVLIHQANRRGMKEKDLPRKMGIYHIEHGRGYTPTGADEMFKRLENTKIPYLSNDDFARIVHKLDASVAPFNDDTWGMSTQVFEEEWV